MTNHSVVLNLCNTKKKVMFLFFSHKLQLYICQLCLEFSVSETDNFFYIKKKKKYFTQKCYIKMLYFIKLIFFQAQYYVTKINIRHLRPFVKPDFGISPLLYAFILISPTANVRVYLQREVVKNTFSHKIVIKLYCVYHKLHNICLMLQTLQILRLFCPLFQIWKR